MKKAFSFLVVLNLSAACAFDVDPADELEASEAVVVAPACSGVAVAPTENLQQKIDSNPAGTTFCLRAGTYRLASQLRPKNGQSFIGVGPTTVVDGDKRTSISFASTATDVKVRYLAIQNFTSKGIQLESGWVADHLDVRLNPVGVAMHGSRPVIKDSKIHHNGGPYTTSPTRSFGLTSNDATGGQVLRNEIYQNNPHCNRTGQNGGGAGANKFWASTGFLLEGNHWHDNFGNGIWLDGSNADFTIRNERVENNTNLCAGTTSKVGGAQGIRLEVSCRATIENSVVLDNDQGAIWINGSYGNLIRNNQLSAPAHENGVIRTVDVHRDSPNGGRYLGNCGGGAYRSSDNRYTDNTIAFVTSRQYVGTYFDPGEDVGNNQFAGNDYRTSSCGASHWRLKNVSYTWSGWRALGQDPGGSCAP
jgi:parallel beta-helix repeat protein